LDCDCEERVLIVATKMLQKFCGLKAVNDPDSVFQLYSFGFRPLVRLDKLNRLARLIKGRLSGKVTTVDGITRLSKQGRKLLRLRIIGPLIIFLLISVMFANRVSLAAAVLVIETRNVVWAGLINQRPRVSLLRTSAILRMGV
jgi:hypothetical protein